MKATTSWITYRTRFLVKAKQLTSSLSFTDVLGRQHSGCKGDYLVESSDGVLRIQPRQIFEDIYVALLTGETETGETQTGETPAGETPPSEATPPQPNTQRPYQALLLEETSHQHEILPPPGTLRRRETPCILSLPSHLTRKSPQPYRDRRSPGPGLRSL